MVGKRRPFVRLTLVLALLLGWLGGSSGTPVAKADPFPPMWTGTVSGAVHYLPSTWPVEQSWLSYTRAGTDTADQRDADPSNGGTSPQNFVNVSSGCTDITKPSVYYAVDPSKSVFFFVGASNKSPTRMRLAPALDPTRAPTRGSRRNGRFCLIPTAMVTVSSPSACRDRAGSPSTPIDTIESIYSNDPSQAVDYSANPNIKLLQHNPTAFIDATTNRLLNFHSTNQPDANWPNGNDETVWDYGTTRASKVIRYIWGMY